MTCKIIEVGKRRDGGTRYWCLTHRADATAKYGVKAEQCRYAEIPQIREEDVLTLNPADYPGGVALWGAAAPVYDTTRLPIDRGIHVHARKMPDSDKEIDETFRSVRLVSTSTDLLSTSITITELDGIYFMVSSAFGFQTEFVVCPNCNFPHLDKDWFAVHNHQRHLCSGCGRNFNDSKKSVGNPAACLRDLYPNTCRPPQSANRKLSLKQADYLGGIQLWGANPAMVWTGKRKEELGVHVHVLAGDGTRVIDDTYSEVIIDGQSLGVEMVRILMAQSALPHIAKRVADMNCPACRKPHFDTGELAYTPHEFHACHHCAFQFRSSGRLRNTIGNPLLDVLRKVSSFAVRPPQVHNMELLPETILGKYV